MYFHTLMRHIKSEKFYHFGFCLKSIHGFSFTPTHWFQFSDKASVVSRQELENLMLVQRFSISCQWAGIVIHVDKCYTFGIKNVSSKSAPVQPKLCINEEIIRCINYPTFYTYTNIIAGRKVSQFEEVRESYGKSGSFFLQG